jgi:hypothetical protein
MKRLFLLLLALGLAYSLGQLGWNVWETTRYFEDHGREATLVIGERYSTEHWSRPLPLKKIYTYTARLEPSHEVMIQTDQELATNARLAIRFLPRDAAAELEGFSLRPIANNVRLRGEADGVPVRVEATNAFDRLVGRAMGPPAPGVYVAPRSNTREAPLARDKPTVPFLIIPAGASTWDIVWKNSRAFEWIAFVLCLFAVQSLLLAAWARQKAAMRPVMDDRTFVHPSLRRQDADAADAPSKKLTYVPKPEQEILLPESEKRRVAEAKSAAGLESGPGPELRPDDAAAEAAVSPALSLRTAKPQPGPALPAPSTPGEIEPPLPAADNPAKAGGLPATPPEELPSLAARETAPPMPISGSEPSLKLRRRTAGSTGETTPSEDSGRT